MWLGYQIFLEYCMHVYEQDNTSFANVLTTKLSNVLEWPYFVPLIGWYCNVTSLVLYVCVLDLFICRCSHRDCNSNG